MATQTFTTTGTWTAPAETFAVQVQAWGAGGSGGSGSAGGSGGSGGGYALKNSIPVVPGTTYNITVGTGGTAVPSGTLTSGNNGGASFWQTGSVVQANGGQGGSFSNSTTAPGVSGGGFTGDSGFTGGNSGNCGSGVSSSGGGGGAGSGGNGGNSSTAPGNGVSAGGTAGTPDGGSGGSGGRNSPGIAGTALGGGGGGFSTTGSSAPSGAGANGQVILTWTVEPATRYWVGGAGNWDGSTTTHWAFTSGGASGAPVPTLAESVFFDANSGGGTVTITAAANCINLTTTGFTGVITGSNALNVYGNLTLAASTLSSYTGTLTFAATSTGFTITGANNALGIVVFNGSGGAWTLQDNWSATSITLTLGALSMGSSTITLPSTGTVWTANGGTLTAGTSTITVSDTSSSSKTFAGGGLTYYNLTFTGGTGVHIITGSNTFNALTITTPPSTINFTAGTTQTVNSFNVTGTSGNLNTLQSTTSGSAWYLASANQISIDYVSLQDSHAIFL